MLHRSFKPAKCKTSLKLATSRIRLLKNKKDVQLKQLKRELAQLLESGKDQTARIRVEHVVREEKTIAAYDLLEIYCELIAARLPIIESQKNCPIDLKEAITSVIFASPRCADIPELTDVRKHFTAKYGKEFISAAVELRPDCGVSRLLVEKLSAKAPDGQMKLKILAAIAEEHNVKWDPESFGEKEAKPPDDLLNGPNTFGMASKMHMEHVIQVSPSNIQTSPSHDQKQKAPSPIEHNAISSSSQNFDSTNYGGGQSPPLSYPGSRPSGTGSERMEARQSYAGHGNVSSNNRQNWNMEFKDATAAAQAAAESAERASMAARAAAELSSRGKITRQHSTESQKSDLYSSTNERPRKYEDSRLSAKHSANDSHKFHDRDPRIRTEEVDENEPDNLDEVGDGSYRDHHGRTKKSSRSASLRSSRASTDDDRLMNDLQKDRFYRDDHGSTERSGQSDSLRSNTASINDDSLTNNIQKDMFFRDEHGSTGRSDQSASLRSGTASIDDHRLTDDLQKDRFYRDDDGITMRYSQAASLRSSTASTDDDKLKNDQEKGDIYSRKGSLPEEAVKGEETNLFSRISMKKQSSNSVVELMSGPQHETSDVFGEARIEKQASSVSSHSHSSCHNHDVSHSTHQKYGLHTHEDPFVSVKQGYIHGDTVQASPTNKSVAVFDESGSDDDEIIFDTLPKDERKESKFYTSSQAGESSALLSADRDTWPGKSTNRSLEEFSSDSHISAEGHLPSEVHEGLTKSSQPSQLDGSPPVTFDDSEGPSSESEDDLSKSRHGGKVKSGFLSPKQNIYSRKPESMQGESHWLTESFLMEKGNSRSSINQNLDYSSDNEELVEGRAENNQGTKYSSPSGREFAFDEEATSHSSRQTKSRLASNDISSGSFHNPSEEAKIQQTLQSSKFSLVNEVNAADEPHIPLSRYTMKDHKMSDQSSLESGKDFNFGTLTGGLRNKGRRPPPYTLSPSAVVSSSSEIKAEDTHDFGVKSSVRSKAGTSVEDKLMGGSDSDDSEQEVPQNSRGKQEPYSPEVNSKLKDKLSSATPTRKYVSDSDDSEEEVPQKSRGKQELFNPEQSKKVNTKSKFSAPVTYFDYGGDSEDDLPSQNFTSTGRAGSGLSRRTKANPSPGKSLYSNNPSPGKSSYSNATIGFKSSGNSDADTKNIASRSSVASDSPPKRGSQAVNSGNMVKPSATEQTSKPMPESNIPSRKEKLKSTTVGEPSRPFKTVTSTSNESTKATTSRAEAPSRENSLKKASHVHPKLPDYDTIAAQLESIRLNRQ